MTALHLAVLEDELSDLRGKQPPFLDCEVHPADHRRVVRVFACRADEHAHPVAVHVGDEHVPALVLERERAPLFAVDGHEGGSYAGAWTPGEAA